MFWENKSSEQNEQDEQNKIIISENRQDLCYKSMVNFN